MFLRLCKRKLWLLYSPTLLAVEPGDSHDQLDLPASDGKHLKDPVNVPEPDNMAGLTLRTLLVIGMNTAMKNGFARKNFTALY